MLLLFYMFIQLTMEQLLEPDGIYIGALKFIIYDSVLWLTIQFNKTIKTTLENTKWINEK